MAQVPTSLLQLFWQLAGILFRKKIGDAEGPTPEEMKELEAAEKLEDQKNKDLGRKI